MFSPHNTFLSIPYFKETRHRTQLSADRPTQQITLGLSVIPVLSAKLFRHLHQQTLRKANKKTYRFLYKSYLTALVRSSGFEPPRGCPRQPLKLVRLPFRHDRIDMKNVSF